MKHLAVLLLALCSACFAQAQVQPAGPDAATERASSGDPDAPAKQRATPGGLDAADERARIRRERTAAEARFQESSRICRGKFAVTDCINTVTREHNAALEELRRQERVLNQEDRRRRAAAHQKDLDERSSPERQQQAAERRQRAVEQQKQRERDAAEKAAKKTADDAEKAQHGPRVKAPPAPPSGPQGTPRAPAAARSHAPTPEETAKSRAAYEARVREAETHRAEVRDRIAKRNKPAASALPSPR